MNFKRLACWMFGQHLYRCVDEYVTGDKKVVIYKCSHCGSTYRKTYR